MGLAVPVVETTVEPRRVKTCACPSSLLDVVSTETARASSKARCPSSRRPLRNSSAQDHRGNKTRFNETGVISIEQPQFHPHSRRHELSWTVSQTDKRILSYISGHTDLIIKIEILKPKSGSIDERFTSTSVRSDHPLPKGGTRNGFLLPS